MKLPVSEIKTNCEKCAYAVYENNSQIGCEANRLNKFKKLDKAIIHTEDEKSWYLLKRFCNLYREEYQDLDEAKKKTALTFGIIVYDHDDYSSDIAIESLKKINYTKGKYKIVISSKHNKNASKLFNYVNYFNKIEDVRCDLFIELDNELVDYNACRTCSMCNFIVKINHDAMLPKNFLKKINESINEKLEVNMLYETNGVSAMPFWYINNNYNSYNNFDKMIDDLREESINANMYKRYER